jgi:NADH:ubiquinone reductase (H+-translocating)
VIVGGGFGGLAAAKALHDADVDVTLVDRMNHHLFQPLLYQVAGGGVSAAECALPIRSQLKKQSNASVLMAEVVDLDIEGKQVVLDRGERLDYDHLIVASGAETSYFGNDALAEQSFGLKSLGDAVRLRDQVFSAFEQAERADEQSARDEWLTFVVVGGGATGVEIAGSLGILAHSTLPREYSRIDARKARVILVDAGDRLVPAFDERLSAKLAGYLAGLGVTVRHHVRATAIDAHGLTVKTDQQEEHIASRTVIWAAGVQAGATARLLAEATHTETDRAGRLRVNPDMTLPGHPEMFAVGDMVSLDGPDGRPLPGLATTAIQQARHVASAIKRGGGPETSTPFHYFDKGALAVVGRGKAVCEVRGHKLSGRPAFLTYLGVHLFYLGGGTLGRLTILTQWLSARFGRLEGRVVETRLADDARAVASAPSADA